MTTSSDEQYRIQKAIKGQNGMSPQDAIDEIIDNGLDVNHKSKTGITPIMSACMNEKNDIEIIKLLFDNGANIKEEKYDKNHYLLILCEKSRSKNILDIMKLLIKDRFPAFNLTQFTYTN